MQLTVAKSRASVSGRLQRLGSNHTAADPEALRLRLHTCIEEMPQTVAVDSPLLVSLSVMGVERYAPIGGDPRPTREIGQSGSAAPHGSRETTVNGGHVYYRSLKRFKWRPRV